MKPFKYATSVISIFAAVFTGCKSYKPLPEIDWQEHLNSKPSSVTLSSPSDASTLALVGNADLNSMRLKAAGAKNVAMQTGWWEDPEVDFDLLRIVNPSDNPFLGGVGFSFTIPVSGVNKAAIKAAEAYHAAELAAITAEELTISCNAEKTALALAYTKEEKQLIEDFDNNATIFQAVANIKSLQASGEYSLSQLNSVMRKIHERKHMVMDIENSQVELEEELKLLAGLKGSTSITISFKTPGLPAKKPAAPDPINLASHVAVKSALAKLNQSEAELITEIRRQYPDLKIGPALGNEEGTDRIGLVAGTTIPAWNRNRQAIAQAEAHRTESRNTALNVWYSLYVKAFQSWKNLVNLQTHPPACTQEKSRNTELKQIDHLFRMGELSPLEYISIREEFLSERLEELRWRKAVSLAEIELKKFNTLNNN